MVELKINISIIAQNRLIREIQADPEIGSKFIDCNCDPSSITFRFDETFDSADETYLRFTFLENFVDVNNDSDFKPRIYDYVVEDAKKKHFHNINYTNEVTRYWYRNEIWGQGTEKGLLLGVDYYADQQKTELILKVRVSYVQDPFGNLVSKQTTRTWVNRNGEDNPSVKGRENLKIYTPLQSRNATDRRRKNIIQQLEGDLISLLLAAAQGDPEQQGLNLNLGVQFLTDAADAINTFYRSGNPSDIIAFVQDLNTTTNYPFLLMEVAPGYTAQQFIIDGISY